MTRIDVVDNHGQFTHLEHRALREMGVETELVDNTTPPDYLEMDVPVLGICLGMQIIANELGGRVDAGEYGGYADVTVEIEDAEDPLVGSLAPETRTWASHADEVKALPPGFRHTGTSDVCGIEAMSDPDRDLYGVQWHPEVAHTEEGEQVFENFRRICE
jgi:GMP synthase (glutamine-hydrolysing)